MVRLILLALAIGALVLAAAAYAAHAAFGLMGLAGVAVATLVLAPVLLKVLGGKLLERLFKLPFKAKGAPLRGARTRVHAIRRATPPAPRADADEEAEAPRDWFVVELTVSPPEAAGPFRHWAPAELLLVAPETDPEDVVEDDEWGVVRKVRGWDADAGGWQEADDFSFGGEQRLRLLVGLRPGAPRVLRLRYYFELFGRIDFARATQAG